MASMQNVIDFELRRTLKKRSFWFASIAPVVIILTILAISYLSGRSAEESSLQQAQACYESASIAVFDESGLIDKQRLVDQNVTVEPSKQDGIDAVRDGRVDAFFYYPENVSEQGIEIYAQDQGINFTPPYNAAAIQLLKQNVIAAAGPVLSNDQVLRILQKDPAITATTFKNGAQTKGLAVIIAPGFFMIAFLTIIILLAYFMISSTTEEKENRTAEILLTSIKARTLILGKILSIFVLSMVQVVIIIVPLFIAYWIFKSHISLPGNVSLSQVPLDPTRITLAAIFFISGLILFIGFIMGLGSLFPSANDAGRFLGLAMIWAFVPLYILAIVINSPHALIVSVFTYFPLTNPTTVLLRNAVGSITVAEAMLALAISIASAGLAVLFAVRAFQYGAMEYGRRISVKELIHPRA